MTGELPTPYDSEADDQDDERRGPEISERSRSVALVLGLLGGVFGLHRFYTGRTESGIYMAITPGEFRDAEGRLVRAWDPQQPEGIGSHRDVQRLDSEIALLHQQMSELAERVDFTERMLAQERERGRLKP